MMMQILRDFVINENQPLNLSKAELDVNPITQQAKKPIELYDLEEDPYEENDLAASMPEKVEAMKKIIADAHVPLPTQKKN